MCHVQIDAWAKEKKATIPEKTIHSSNENKCLYKCFSCCSGQSVRAFPFRSFMECSLNAVLRVILNIISFYINAHYTIYIFFCAFNVPEQRNACYYWAHSAYMNFVQKKKKKQNNLFIYFRKETQSPPPVIYVANKNKVESEDSSSFMKQSAFFPQLVNDVELINCSIANNKTNELSSFGTGINCKAIATCICSSDTHTALHVFANGKKY